MLRQLSFIRHMVVFYQIFTRIEPVLQRCNSGTLIDIDHSNKTAQHHANNIFVPSCLTDSTIYYTL